MKKQLQPDAKERRKEYSKKWREANKERLKAYARAIASGERKVRPKLTSEQKAIKKKEDYKKWRQKNLEHCRAYAREYAKSPKSRAKHNAWYAKRRKQFPELYRERRRAIMKAARQKTEVRVLESLRARLNKKLRQGLAGKFDKTMALCGCDIPTLIDHLEKQFKPGMSWQNYGREGWHIDHIIPCSSFDLKKLDHQKICFNYKNLQPLWACENMSKGAKIIPFTKAA